MTLPQHGVVDTAAQSGLIGEETLKRLQNNLKCHGLKVVWKNKQAQARGVDGQAQVVGVVGHWRGLRSSRTHSCQRGCPTFAANSIAS